MSDPRICPAEELRELRKREKEQGIQSNWEIDSFMAADTLEGKREAIVTEYILRILGLDVRHRLPFPAGTSVLCPRFGTAFMIHSDLALTFRISRIACMFLGARHFFVTLNLSPSMCI